MHDRATFLYGSLADMQATIRAIDVKVAAILVCLLAPLQNLHRVFKHLAHFTDWSIRWPAIVVVVLFLITWVVAFVALVRAIAAVGNPAAHIQGATNANGAFFLPGQFKFSRFHALRNPRNLYSRDTLTDVHSNLPSNQDIESVLVFEQMKLAYIRDIKLFRLDWGLKLSVVWLGLGILIYFGSKFVIEETPKKMPTRETVKISPAIATCQINTCCLLPAYSSKVSHIQCVP